MTDVFGSERRRARILAYAPVLIWIVVILVLSSDFGSMSRTSRIIRPVLQFLFPTASEDVLQVYHGYVRKAAHVTEYAVLGILASRALRKDLGRPIFWFMSAAALVLLVASIDEIQQSFLASRTGTPWDVGLDVIGGLTGALAYWLFAGRRRPILSK